MTAPTAEREPLIVVIDDDASVRSSIADLLGSVGFESRAFGSPGEFLRIDWDDPPACLVLDVRLPELSGLDLQQELDRMGMAVPIVFITAHGDVQMSVRAMKSGASDFLTKPFRDQDLLDAVNEAIRKDRARRQAQAALDPLRQRYASLNAGERQVLASVVAGMLNKQIASTLGLSEVTVKVRRASIMRKLNAGSLAELVQIAARLGVTGEPRL